MTVQSAGFTGYVSTGSGTGSPGGGSDDDGMSVNALRRQYTDFQSSKWAEIEEQRLARHYYHGDQLTKDELKELQRRGQPATIRNRVDRKINGVVGLIERLRQDPKAYPRTPKHEAGADIATASIRYVCDVNNWETTSSNEARIGAINGPFGVQMHIGEGDRGDPDIEIDPVAPDTFFYDPTSFEDDFSDARYMGIAKWVDLDVAKEMFPDKEEELNSLIQTGPGAESWQQQDREYKWIDTAKKRIFLVEHEHIYKGDWYTCFWCSDLKLGTFKSRFYDEKDKTTSSFIMGSANVDHDGDRYGFVRNLKPLQDEVNARASKRLHLINSRRIIAEVGAVADIDKARREAIRADGYLEVNPGKRFEFDDTAKLAEAASNVDIMQEVKDEIENFGPNPALIGQGIENKSGRAIALLQQAGIAELGPFILSYRGWKIRVYRAIWNAIRRHWKAERWMRITDDDDAAQFAGVNVLDMDPMTGQPVLVSVMPDGTVVPTGGLDQLDVDILIDEGPDTLTVAQDNFDLLQALAQGGADVPPELLIELSQLNSTIKAKALDILQQQKQPSEFDQKVMDIKTAEAEGKARKVNAEASKIEGEAETGPMKDRAQAWRDVSSGAASIAKARQPQPMPPDGF